MSKKKKNQRSQAVIPNPTNSKSVSNTTTRTASFQAFSGPMPPPELLQKYNEVVPGAAERILAMAEKQANHRQTLELEVIMADVRRSNWGLVAGFVISVLALGASTASILTGHDVAGASIFGVSIISIVTTFVIGVRTRKKERDDKSIAVKQ